MSMKKVITLLMIMMFALTSFSQFSKSFFNDISYGLRSTELFEINGVNHFISTKLSSQDTVRITYGEFDVNGTTSNYHTIEYSGVNTVDLSISGVGVDNSNNIVLATMARNSVNADLSYIKIDPISHNIVQFVQMNESYKRGYCRTLQKGDSLITYTMIDPVGIKRIATSVNNITSFSEQVVDASSSFSSAFTAFRRATELLISGEKEYVIYDDKVLLRESNGSVSSTTIATSAFMQGTLIQNGQGQIAVVKSNKYFILDSTLNLLSNGTIPYSAATGIEGIATPNGYRIYAQITPSSGRILDYDASFNLIQEKEYRNFNPYGIRKINGNVFVHGQLAPPIIQVRYTGQPTTQSLESVFIIQDELTSFPEQFTEYDEEVELGKFLVKRGHLGLFNNTTSSTPAIQYKLNNIYRSVFYGISSTLIGKNNSNEIIGDNTNLGSTNYLPGPITSVSEYSYEEQDEFSRSYYVTRDMIEDHRTNIGLSNPNYKIPYGILKWPAHGDPSKGQATDIAPYIDHNANGVYDPENGDYPSIQGTSCILNIYHHSPNYNHSSEIEVHDYLFWFDCDTSEALTNTLFNKTQYITRGVSMDSIYQFRTLDIDAGYPYDDFVGTDVELGLLYNYNGDNYDEDYNTMGFHDTLASPGVLVLSGVKQINDGVDNDFGSGPNQSVNGLGFNDGVVDNEILSLVTSISGDNATQTPNVPITLAEFFNAGSGILPNGTMQQTNGVNVRHAFFSKTDPYFYSSGGINHGNFYTEELVGNIPGDRYSFAISGPGQLANTYDTTTNFSAYIVGIDTINLNALSSIQKLKSIAYQLKNGYANNSLGCGYNFDPYISLNDASINEGELNSLNVYPNPSDQLVTIENIGTGNSEIMVADINGRIVLSTDSKSDKVQLDVSQFVNGIYIIRVANEYGVRNVRFVKK